jgi:hypothetical protein
MVPLLLPTRPPTEELDVEPGTFTHPVLKASLMLPT